MLKPDWLHWETTGGRSNKPQHKTTPSVYVVGRHFAFDIRIFWHKCLKWTWFLNVGWHFRAILWLPPLSSLKVGHRAVKKCVRHLKHHSYFSCNILEKPCVYCVSSCQRWTSVTAGLLVDTISSHRRGVHTCTPHKAPGAFKTCIKKPIPVFGSHCP